MRRCDSLGRFIVFVTLSLLLLLLAAFTIPVLAQERVRVSVFGPEVFTRTTGKPKQEIRTFTAPKADTPLTLRVTNGNPPVTSGIIQLNKKTIFTPDDFKAKVNALTRTISLAPGNTLSVELRSKPDAFITIEIFGDFLPPAPARIDSIPSATPQATQTITGTAAPGGTVFISGGAQQASGPCDPATGAFSIDVALEEGANHLLAWVTDPLGLTSDKTSLDVIVDTTPPQIAITSPPDQSEHAEPLVTVTGTIDDHSATVTVNGVQAHIANHTFTAAGIQLSERENIITATAIDPVGNTASDRIQVTLCTKKDHDLTPYLIDASGVSTNAQSLKTAGTVHITIANHGKDPVSDSFELILFEDRGHHSDFNPATDPVLGRTTVSQSIPGESSLDVTLQIMGERLFPGNPIYVSIDPTDWIREADETNNIGTSAVEGIDLTGSLIRIEKSGCPEEVILTARLGNAGSIAVGAGVKVAFYAADASGHLQWIGTGLTTTPLATGEYEDVTIAWEMPGVGTKTIYVTADDTGGGSGLYVESDEANNLVTTDFELCTILPSGGENSIAGRVIDAVTGRPIAEAKVRLKIQNQGVPETIAQGNTSPYGYYLFEGIPGGIYIIEAEHPGFIPGSRQAILDAGQSLTDQHMVLSPVLADGEIRIVLMWGETPADLEAHLTGPNPQGCRYHCYFWEKSFPGAQLDKDSHNGYGPETITITRKAPGIYRYYVHDWTNRCDRTSIGLAGSKAEVRVYSSNTKALQVFTVPAGPGTLWHVFDLNAYTGQIFPVNIMTSQDDAGEVDFPVITSQPVTTAAIGAPYTYRVEAVDPDHDPLHYTLEQAPDGMTIDPATGLIRWTPTQNTNRGMHTVQVRVFDGRCGTNMQTFDIQVRSLMVSVYPEKIYAGQPCTLSWTCDPAYTCSIDQGIGAVASSGSLEISPADDTTYTMTATGPGATRTATATIVVEPEVQIASSQLCDWAPGDRIPLTWSANGAETCVINQGIGEVSPEGTLDVFHTEPTRYTLTAYSSSGIAVDAVAVPQIEDCATPTPFLWSASPPEILCGESTILSWDSVCPHDRMEIYEGNDHNIRLIGTGDRTGNITVSPTQTTSYTAVRYRSGRLCGSKKICVIVHNAPLASLSASSRTFHPGQPVTLTWTTQYTESCVIDPGIGQVPVHGSIEVYPTQPTTYTLTATGLGSTATDSVFVSIPNPVATLCATPSILKTRIPTTLRWTTYHAETYTIEPGIGEVPLNGNLEVCPSETTTYTLTATGPGGTTTSRATVFYAKPTVSITADPPVIIPGEPTTLHWVSGLADYGIINQDIGHVDPNESLEVAPTAPTTYTITVYGPGGTATADVTVSLLTVSLSPFPPHISSGQESTLTWRSTHAETCFIEPGIGEVPANGSIQVAPTENTTYTITAAGFDRTVNASATVAIRIADDIDIQPIAIEPHTATDTQTLAISGYVDVRMEKTGNEGELEPFQVIVFEDRNRNEVFDPGTDVILGTETVAQWREETQRSYPIPVNGTVLFADNRLYALVDAHDVLHERDEANNIMHTGINMSDTIDLTSAFIRTDPSLCPAATVLRARVGNGGNLLAPSGVPITFYDGSPADGGSLIGTVSTTDTLPPGAFQDLCLIWSAPIPGMHTIYVWTDDDGIGPGGDIERDKINNLARAYLAICRPALGDDPGSIAGWVLDAQTKVPLEGALVFLRAIGNGGAGTVMDMTKSGADGAYRFDVIPPGTYVVEGSLVGYRIKCLPIMLCSGEPLTGQDLRLLPHLAVTITSPADGSDVGVSLITVTGTVSHDKDTVMVNGVPAVVADHTFTAERIELTDGENMITALAWDADGNMAEKRISVTLDPTPLAVYITEPSDGATISRASITVRFSVSSPSAKVTVNGIPSDPWDDAVYHVPVAEGANTLTATATDPSGRIATHRITVYGDPDLPPALTIIHPCEQSVYQSPITVSGAIADETATVLVNGVTAIVADHTFTADIPLSAGDNRITATATDTDGKTASDSVTVTYYTGSPTCKILWPKTGFIEYMPYCYVEVRSSLGTILVNGATERYGAWVDGDYYATFKVDLTEGPNVITAVASDSNGNTAQARITGFYAGEDWPWVCITSPAPGETIPTDRVDIIGTVEGDATFVTVNGIPATVTNNTFTAKNIALTQGYNDITVTATGPYNALETATVRVYCDDTTPPFVTITTPQDGSEISASPITVNGTMDDNNATVTVNGVSAVVTNNTFTAAGIYLTPGINTITVNARDPQGNTGQTNITVTCTKRVHVTITSPSHGATINRAEVMVKGTYAADAEGVVIMVNDRAAMVLDNGKFIANAIPLESGENTLTATITGSDGHTDAYPITIYSDKRIEDVRLTSNIQSGVPPLDITFTVDYDYNHSIKAKIVQAEIDFDGDGAIDWHPTSTTLTHTFVTPGVYYPTITVTDALGNRYTGHTAIVVYDRDTMDTLLKSKWKRMKEALMDGDVEGAVSYFAAGTPREMFRYNFNLLRDELPEILANMGSITLIRLEDNLAEYELIATQDGVQYSFYVEFIKDKDGVWRLTFF